MRNFVAGALMFGYVVIGLIFLKFWRRTGDRFFAAFAASFWLMALHSLLESIVTPTVISQFEEDAYRIFLVRLSAYVMIIVAIVDKNRARPGRPSPDSVRRADG